MGDAVSEFGEAGRGKGYYNLEENLGAQDGTPWMGWNDKRATASPGTPLEWGWLAHQGSGSRLSVTHSPGFLGGRKHGSHWGCRAQAGT